MAAPVASTSLSAGNVVASARKAKPAGKQLGTLVVVVIKARNLPNKQRIGKQDPYCSITVGHQKQKTPAVKRGGQTPHWDAQLQFEIWEESSDKVPVATTDTGGIGPASSIALKRDEELLPNQATVGRVKLKTGSADASKRIMKIACYADDPREPELIGETEIDYAPTLKKGEFDEWVEIKHKGKYAGEVFVEMTFYSAAPPPVKRKSKPAVPGSGYGGPGHFEPLPDTFPQSPEASSLRPSAHLSPSPAHHLRMSQSSYSLNTSTSHPPPAASPSLDEFGRRKHTPVGFPVPSHSQTSSSGSTDASYNPPYAPPSLAPSTSTSHLAKPHRASFSSYGMTQHDIDSMLRPLSSLSIGGSVNKPLPLPQPHAGQPYRPSPSPARPLSGQGFAMAPQPSPSPRPYAVSPSPIPQQTPVQHHYSQPGQYQQPPPSEPYADAHPPSHHHRHSMTTYLPDGSEVPWNANQIPQHPAHQQVPQEIGLHNLPPVEHQPYRSPGGSWQDPRATSPYPSGNSASYHEPPSPAYNPASPSQSASYHPASLQPGTSPQFAHMSPPPPSHSPLPHPSDPPVWNNAQHYSSPVLGEPLRQDASHFDPYNQPQHHQDQQQQPIYQAPPEPQHDSYAAAGQPSGQYHDQNNDPRYQQYANDQQQYAYDQAPVQAGYEQEQQYDHGYPQNGYVQSQDAGSYQQSAPPVDQYAYQPPAAGPHSGHLQQDYRTNSPYRPLPQPAPESASQSSYQQAPYYPQAQAEPQPQPPPPRQPRFGLPVHQPYDPPYIPPSSRQSSHYQPAMHQPQAQQVPPPIPPVPQELRYDQHNSYGYNSHRY